MSQQELKSCPIRDKLRELLLPAVLLTVLGSIWAVGYSRERAEDAQLPSPPLKLPERLVRSGHADATGPAKIARVRLDR